jgi:DNA-binding sugar fermentation-stimulating protein
MQGGVEAVCYSCRIDTAGISLAGPLPIDV